MREIVEQLSNDIIGPVITEKVASEILSHIFEKQAGGVGAFAEALSGSKARKLKGEVSALADEVAKRSKSPKLDEAGKAVEDIKNSISNSVNHERMDNVKDNLDLKREKYQSISRKHDDTLNWYTGAKTPLRLISPKYWAASAHVGIGKLGLRNAKAQYKAQQRRIEKDLIEDLAGAKSKLNSASKETGLNVTHEQLDNKMKELQHAENATRSARGIALGGAALGGGAYLYNKHKNSPGPYTYGGDYNTNRLASSADSNLIEKLSEEIIQCMYEK